MNKYAQEKIAQHYYQLGMSLAMQNAGLGMSKTANRKAILAGLAGGLGGAAALPGLKGMGQDVAKYLQEAYSTMRAPQIMENADLARFAENLRQGNMPTGFTNALAAGENMSLGEAKALSNFFEGKGTTFGDDWLANVQLPSFITPLVKN